MGALKRTDRILVTGGTGLIGTNLTSSLIDRGLNVISVGSEHDLRSACQTDGLFNDVRPTIVFHLAARVGGIHANSTQKSTFYYDNVTINTNVIKASTDLGVKYVFAMGTGCAYPKRLEDSILFEHDFLDGIPEETNDAYAYAKRSLLVHLEALAQERTLKYTYCLPANIYGPHDNFHPTHSHVVPGLIRRFIESQQKGLEEVNVWGDGSAQRDFLYIDDCISAIIQLADLNFEGAVNVGTGHLTSITNLAESIKLATGYKCRIKFDTSFPAGQKHRMFDLSKVKSVGWKPKIEFSEGIRQTCSWFRENQGNIREL